MHSFDNTMDNIEPGGSISLLHFPEPILECILKLLSPKELVGMTEVCTCLRDRCRSDPLWEVHIKQKWGGVIGDVAFKEWQWHITTTKEKQINQLDEQINQKGSLGSFNGTWPMLYLRSYVEDCSHLNSSLSNSFMMSLYFSLENGKFWFPAQVYRVNPFWLAYWLYFSLRKFYHEITMFLFLRESLFVTP